MVAIEGNFDDALRVVRELGRRADFEIVNSINPHRIAGQKTAAFEIVEELGDAPDLHLLPVGNAGNITAYWAGYREYHAAGKATRLPAMLGFQAEGAAPIVHGKVIERPETIATAIRIGHPASWESANEAIGNSEGAIDLVSDEEILAAQQWLASHEGIFVEPASAASIAGLFKSCDRETAAAFPLMNRLQGRKPDRLHRHRARLEGSRMRYASRARSRSRLMKPASCARSASNGTRPSRLCGKRASRLVGLRRARRTRQARRPPAAQPGRPCSVVDTALTSAKTIAGRASSSSHPRFRMRLIVQKYGGTSVGTPERIRKVARTPPRNAAR